LLSIIAFLFVLGVLVFIHELGHFIFAKLVKVRVEIFSLGFGKKLWSFKKGDTEYRISMIPFGGYVKPAGENPEEEREGAPWEFLSKSVGHRALIVGAGPVFNYLLAFFLFSLVLFVGVPQWTATVGELKDDYPAKIAGLEKNDRILSIDGTEIKFWDELSEIIHSKTDSAPVRLNIKRDDQIFTKDIVPKVETITTILGKEAKIGLIGIGPSDDTEIVRYGFFKSIAQGGRQVFMVTKMTYFALFQMATGKISAKEIAGPVGIFKFTGEAAKQGFLYLLSFIGLLSVNLAILNLLPIPVLDGGHLLFLVWEKFRGKPASLKAQEIATKIGFSLIILLMMFAFYNDLARLGAFDKILNIIGSNAK